MSALPSPQAGTTPPISWAASMALAIGLAALAGPMVAVFGVKALLGSLALSAFLVIAIRPEYGAYLYLLMAPLITGIPRGSAIPLIRPNEALLILIVGAICARMLALSLSAKPIRFDFSRIDVALVLLILTGSVIPLLLSFGRGLEISTDDVLYAAVFFKIFLLYRLFLYAVSTPSQVAVCLVVAMLSAALVAAIAALQVLDLFGVSTFLWNYYDRSFGGISGAVSFRGASTLGSSFALADMMIMNLAIVLAWLCGEPGRWRLVPIAVGSTFILGCIVSGQFSAFIGLGVATLAVGFMTGQLRRILAMLTSAMLVGSIVFWPVVEKRLSDFNGAAGLPQSWTGRDGRLDNLQRFVWPELSSGANWLIGVRPTARIPAPEPWRDWVYIESGYIWILWTGGLPMVAAFVYFVWATYRKLSWAARENRSEPPRLAATACIASLTMLVTLMLFDPHLTLRGSSDLFFALLALSLVGSPGALGDQGVRLALRPRRSPA